MKRFLSLALVFVLLIALLTGCTPKQKLRGTWSCTLDLTDAMQSILSEQWGEDAFAVTDFRVPVLLTFQKDDTVTVSLDAQGLQTATDRLLTGLENHFIGLLEDRLTETGKEVSLEDLLGVTGLDRETLLSQFRQNFTDEDFAGQLSSQYAFSGWFKPSGDKLYLSDTEEIGSDSFYITYSIKDGVLSLAEPGDTESPLTTALLETLPSLTFQKAS